MTVLKIIGIIFFLALCIALALSAIGWLLILIALDLGWDKEWIDKEDRENGNN